MDDPLSLIMGDIDHFKKVNDTYGHQAGDEILRRFVACLKNEIRKEIDWIARYGGEEFLLVFPETDFDKRHADCGKITFKSFQNAYSA